MSCGTWRISDPGYWVWSRYVITNDASTKTLYNYKSARIFSPSRTILPKAFVNHFPQTLLGKVHFQLFPFDGRHSLDRLSTLCNQTSTAEVMYWAKPPPRHPTACSSLWGIQKEWRTTSKWPWPNSPASASFWNLPGTDWFFTMWRKKPGTLKQCSDASILSPPLLLQWSPAGQSRCISRSSGCWWWVFNHLEVDPITRSSLPVPKLCIYIYVWTLLITLCTFK